MNYHQVYNNLYIKRVNSDMNTFFNNNNDLIRASIQIHKNNER